MSLYNRLVEDTKADFDFIAFVKVCQERGRMDLAARQYPGWKKENETDSSYEARLIRRLDWRREELPKGLKLSEKTGNLGGFDAESVHESASKEAKKVAAKKVDALIVQFPKPIVSGASVSTATATLDVN